MGLTRRELFKLGSAGLVSMGGLTTLAPRAHGFPVRHAKGEPVDTVCGSCSMACRVRAYRARGRVVAVEPLATACPRATAAVTTGPGRLTEPLRRVGKRGDARFETSTWEAFFAEVGPKLAALRGSGTFAVVGGVDRAATLASERLAALLGSTDVWTGPAGPWMATSGGAPEVVLAFGSDLRENSPGLFHGASWVVFDPRCSNTAGSPGSTWVPIRPGTDGLAALALARLLLDGAGSEGARWPRGLDREAKARLRKHLEGYDPESVAKVCGLEPGALAKVATRLAHAESVAVVAGPAVMARRGGHPEAISLLAALVGAAHTDGARLTQPFPAPPEPEAKTFAEPPVHPLAVLAEGGEWKADALLVWDRNPAWDCPSRAEVVRMLGDESRVGLLVVLSPVMDTTASLADWVLPSATWLERWGVEASPVGHEVRLRRPVVPPPASARSPLRVLLDLAMATGGAVAKGFGRFTERSFCEGMLHREDELLDAGGLERLLKGSVWRAGWQPEAPGLPTELPTPARPDVPDGIRLVACHMALARQPDDYLSPWLLDRRVEGLVWMARTRAVDLGLADHQLVEVVSPVGAVRGRLFLTEGLHPDVVVLAWPPEPPWPGYGLPDPEGVLPRLRKLVRGPNPGDLVSAADVSRGGTVVEPRPPGGKP